jgi:uncharacterized protein
MRAVSIIFLLFLLTGGIQAQNKQSTAKQKQKTQNIEKQMRNYFMVILTKGPNRGQDSVSLSKLMDGHMANIERLTKEGKLILAGPFLDDGNMRGIFVFNVTTNEEAVNLVESDPAVKAGRFTYEIHPWMGPKKLTSLLNKPNKKVKQNQK